MGYSSDLAFSEELRHFIREVNPTNTMAYDKGLYRILLQDSTYFIFFVFFFFDITFFT